MGQHASVPTGVGRGRRKSFRESWRSPFPRRSQTHQGSLSAAFSFIDVDLKIDQLNVNTASEEELMTLPGITRTIAQNIIEYRQAIGRFKKVEDLAVVSGIGAEKLDIIKPEICVSRRKNVSCASSRAQSIDSLPSSELNNYSRLGLKDSPHLQSRVVNVNTANVFELMTVRGLNQELAANVIHYREKKGPFHKIEDLIKVTGINQWRLGALRHHLTVGNTLDVAAGNTLNNGTVISTPSQNSSQHMNGKPLVVGTRKATSTLLKNTSNNGFIPGNDIFELLSAYSQRPILEEDFHGLRNGKRALRIATWNLQAFTQEKAENPGVKEVICRTILENSFSVIAVQEIVGTSSLKQICDELNCPTLRRVIDWKDNEREWRFALLHNSNSKKGSPSLGFLYDTSYLVELAEMKELCGTGPLPTTAPKVEALLSSFKVEGLTISLLNMYIQSCDINSIERMLQGHVEQTDMLIILGDFTGLSQCEGESGLSKLQYKSVIPVSSNSHCCSSDTQTCHYSDNILLNSEVQPLFTGVSGMVVKGLNHLAIPRGWRWGGPASEHCPVWCEVYTAPVLAEEELPNGTHHLE